MAIDVRSHSPVVAHVDVPCIAFDAMDFAPLHLTSCQVNRRAE